MGQDHCFNHSIITFVLENNHIISFILFLIITIIAFILDEKKKKAKGG